MSELLDQIEALIEALTQPDDHPKRALFAVGDVARLLAAVRAVEGVINSPYVAWVEEGPEGGPAMVSVAEVRRALTEALEGER